MDMMSLRPQVPITLHQTHHTQPLQDFTKKLIITQQTCLVQEKFSKNGVQKDVHVVVKNNPFVLNLALLDKQFNFHNFSTEIQLVYDCATLKEVDFVKLKPLECKTRPSDDGDQLTVEIRIKVLTSQLEDMFFRVVIKLVDPRTRKEYSQLICLSHPIRVVSKPDQVKKKIKKRKRAPTDSLMEYIDRIEQQQREQRRLLKHLCGGEGIPDIASDDSSSEDSVDSPQPQQPPQPQVEKEDFRNAFSNFLVAFKRLQSTDTDGSQKIQTSAADARTMCEILELIRAEVKKERALAEEQHQLDPDAPCSCEHCPYKEKMEKISQSMVSAVPDTSVSTHIPVMPHIVAPSSDLQVHQHQAPSVVSTEAIDGAIGGLFDANLFNSFLQMQGMGVGVGMSGLLGNLGVSGMTVPNGGIPGMSGMANSGFSFANAFGEFNPMSLFGAQQAI